MSVPAPAASRPPQRPAIDPIEVIGRFYDLRSKAGRLLIRHGRAVAGKALQVAARFDSAGIDRSLVAEAAWLHDIGIFLTRTPELGCNGPHPYVRHGWLGGRILRRLGLPQHALVCERHVGCGISAAEIRGRGLPLPERDLLPVSLEEQLVCYADKFFSKNGAAGGREKTVPEIVAGLMPYGPEQVARFLAWVERFEGSGDGAG